MSRLLCWCGVRPWSLIALFGLLAIAAPPARADSLNVELGELAKDVKKLLDGRDKHSVAVGEFTPLPGSAGATAGPAIAKGLTDELTRLGITVNLKDELTVEGRYGLREDGNAKPYDDGRRPLAVALVVKVVDKFGEPVVGLELKPRGVFGNTAAAVLLGLTVDLPPTAGAEERDRKLDEVNDKPKAYLDGTRVNAAGGRPFGLEVLVKQPDGGFTARAATDNGGQAYVELKKDEVYRVRIYDDADYEIAVRLTIDGLNMFAFTEVRDPKTQEPLYDQLLVRAHSSYDIPGWHRNNGKKGSNEFLVTKYADCPAAKLLGNSAAAGTITATFAAAWPTDQEPPADEPRTRSADLGTKPGDPTGDDVKEVERRVGVTRAAISVRYSK